MRLSDILSKDPTDNFEQVDGFFQNKRATPNVPKKISVGNVLLSYHCDNCQRDVLFSSGKYLYCTILNKDKQIISIVCVLKCVHCEVSFPVWFLVEVKGDIHSVAPMVRIIKRFENLSGGVTPCKDRYGEYAELLGKAERAYRAGLGAGAIVYLRKILECVTIQTAVASGIQTSSTNKKGVTTRKNFKSLLEEVDHNCAIIPREFSNNGYKLFKELSKIIHSDGSDEQDVLEIYDAFYRLVIGVLDNVKNNRELTEAIAKLGWRSENGDGP